MLCQSESTLLPGPCPSQGRWVGLDGKVRCSLHQIQEFGHAEPLVRVEGYTPPRKQAARKPKRQKVSRKDEVTDTSPKRKKREETQ